MFALYFCNGVALFEILPLMETDIGLFGVPSMVCVNSNVCRCDLRYIVTCCLSCRLLQGGSVENKHNGGPQFAEVFVIVWFGAVVITLNSKLLGGTM